MRESLRFLALQQSNASSTDAIKVTTHPPTHTPTHSSTHSPTHSLTHLFSPVQLWAQVKLTLSQLVVLRISRQRDPVKLLERIIKEEHSFTGEERRYVCCCSIVVVLMLLHTAVKDLFHEEGMYMCLEENISMHSR